MCTVLARFGMSTEQLAIILTTIQWKSLMRLLDILPPSDSNVDRSFSETYCSAASQKQKTSRDVERLQLSARRRKKVGRGKGKLEDSVSYGIRSAW